MMLDFAFRIVLTYGIYAYLVFFLGLKGLCTRPWIIAVSLFTLALLIWLLRPVWLAVKKDRIHLPTLALYLGLGIIFAHALFIPPFVRDDMIYHLLVPKQMAMTGKLTFDPFNLNSNFPMLFEMPLAVLETLRLPISPFIFNVGFALLLLAVFHAGLSRYTGLKRFSTFAAIAALATTPVLFNLLHTCYVEIFFALLITLAALLYARHLEAPESGRDWLRVGACLGLATAVKYPGWIFALLFFTFEFFRAKDRKTFYAGLLLIAALASPWYVKNWIWTGNPVFPFLNGLFHSPWVSADRFEGFRRMLVDYNMGRGLGDTFLLPFKLALGVDSPRPAGSLGFDGKLSLFFLVSLFGLGWKGKFRFFSSLLFVAYFTIWAMESQQARLLLPILPIAILFGLERMEGFSRLARWMAPVMILILAQNTWNVSRNFNSQKISHLLLGKLSRDEFLRSHMPISYGWAGEINRRLDPARHKLMTVGSFGRNYYFDVPVLTNTYYDQEIFRKHFERGRLEPDSVTAFLDRNGVTHLLFNWDFVQKMHVNDGEFDIFELMGFFQNRFKAEYQDGNPAFYTRIKGVDFLEWKNR